MDDFERDRLGELLAYTGEPAVSIYVPTDRTGISNQEGRLHLRAALERAAGWARPGTDPDILGGMLSPLRTLLDDDGAWLQMLDGLAIFVAPGIRHVLRVPVSFEPLTVVGTAFHLRPLARTLMTPQRFWVLALSQNEVRLWRGEGGGLEPEPLEGVPTSRAEALGEELVPDQVGFYSSGDGGKRPIYFGRGMGESERKAEIEHFFHILDKHLYDRLAPGGEPIVLAGIEYEQSMFRAATRLENLLETGIEGNVNHWTDAEVHARAWAIVQRSAGRRIDEALALWESAWGRGKTATEVAEIARLAVAGRVHELLLEDGYHVWGRLDRGTAAVVLPVPPPTGPGPELEDVLDGVAAQVLTHGGTVLEVPAERVPLEGGVAAILR